MKTIKFDKEYWIYQLRKEVGLEDVIYEDLDKHFVNFESLISDENVAQKNAKEYVDEQLALIEEKYKEFEESEEEYEVDLEVPEFNPEDVLFKLSNVVEFIDKMETAPLPIFKLDGIVQLEEVKQEIRRNDMKYFEVLVGNKNFIIAVNVHSDDCRIMDQVNHIKATSFFVEERTPATFVGGEDIISYYQFINYIQPYLKQTATALDKISENVTTSFDGLKLEGFND
jgi:hypothetical protein